MWFVQYKKHYAYYASVVPVNHKNQRVCVCVCVCVLRASTAIVVEGGRSLARV